MDGGGIRLVQKRQLLGLPNNLRGRLSDEIFQRPSKVRLIKIACQMDSVENGDAFL